MNFLTRRGCLNRCRIGDLKLSIWTAQTPRGKFNFWNKTSQFSDDMRHNQGRVPQPQFDKQYFETLKNSDPFRAQQYENDAKLQMLQKAFYENEASGVNHYQYFKELNRQQRYSKVIELYGLFTEPMISYWKDDQNLVRKINDQVDFAAAQIGFVKPPRKLFQFGRISKQSESSTFGNRAALALAIAYVSYILTNRFLEYAQDQAENEKEESSNGVTKSFRKIMSLFGEDQSLEKEPKSTKSGLEGVNPKDIPESLKEQLNKDDSQQKKSTGKNKSSGNNGLFSKMFDRSSEIQEEKNITTRFSDVLGIDEFKEELTELVDYLKNPKKYQDAGAKLPKGILIVGPPGTGKTLLARALAGEAGCSFYYKSGSEFDEMFVGVGASRVRELFKKARQTTPSIIFLDEIDSVCGKRSAADQSHSRDTVNQILAEMDGFKEHENVIVIGATNFEKSIDHAVRRPGRFDKTIHVPYPDIRGREELFTYYLKKIQKDQLVLSKELARQTSGFTGADIQNMVNVAILQAIKCGRVIADKKDFDFALDRIAMGVGRKNMFITEEDKLKTAYHEGGHTLMSLFTKESTPLHKVTILPRGGALGFTSFVPETDKLNYTKRGMIASIDVAMGGRVAEEIHLGNAEISTGCSNDLQKATEMAYAYVKELGMNENLTLISQQDNGVKTSDQYNHMLDKEVQKILKESYDRTKKMMKQHEQQLKNLANELVKHETLDAEQVKRIVFEGKSIA